AGRPLPAGAAPAGNGATIDSWLAIARDGSVTIFTDKVELGMGVSTAFAQIVAEELDVPVQSVSVIMGDTALTPDQGGVGGSTSIAVGANPVRQAAAEGRRILLGLASARLSVPADRLSVRDGIVRVTGDAARSVSYGDLIGGRRFDAAPTTLGGSAAGPAQPKLPDQYKIVGQPVRRMDIPPKAAGRYRYVVDVRMPGMLHGRVVRPPVPGAKPVRIDGPQGVPGVAKVVAKESFVGVVADSEWNAIQASRKLSVTWSMSEARWPVMGDDLYRAMWAMTPTTRQIMTAEGDADTAFKTAARTIEARYEWPFQSHAMMGPSCAVADVRNGAATIWSSTQHPHQLQQGIAQLLGVPADKVHVVWMPGAGSYGRAGADDAAGDAALLSQAAGRPVRVQWMRADETGWDPKGPPVVMAVRAGLDARGTVVAWDYTARGFSGSGTPATARTAGDMLAGQLTGLPAGGTDALPALRENYVFAAKRKAGEIVPWPQEGSPLRTSNLRAPSQPATTFGGESFVDEVAAAAGADPVEFRLRYIREPRDAAVIRAAAQRAGWVVRPSPRRDVSRSGIAAGRGIAYTPRGNTVVATVAEVQVNQDTGEVRVTRFVIAHDCGLIINPDGLRGTIEANLIQSMSRALKEEVRFDKSGVTSVDWHTYPVLMAPEAPDAIEIVLINHPELPPYGAGEPASVATAPAIANAIFDATGARVRTVPFTPERVKAALAQRTA
ncbi:MAG TPA: molybdopterin cofactor-binding domain-containing protein, partial [bacterium]|nr:molybdopterin cofactor-binding domain-containing protein [bacterium]